MPNLLDLGRLLVGVRGRLLTGLPLKVRALRTGLSLRLRVNAHLPFDLRLPLWHYLILPGLQTDGLPHWL